MGENYDITEIQATYSPNIEKKLDRFHYSETDQINSSCTLRFVCIHTSMNFNDDLPLNFREFLLKKIRVNIHKFDRPSDSKSSC